MPAFWPHLEKERERKRGGGGGAMKKSRFIRKCNRMGCVWNWCGEMPCMWAFCDVRFPQF